MLPDRLGDLSGQLDRDGIPDSLDDLESASNETGIVWEALQPRAFPNRDGSMGLRMEITTLLRLGELRPNRERRRIPPKSPHKVGTTAASGILVYPTLGLEMPRKVLSVADRRDVPVTLQGQRAGAPGIVEVGIC